MQDILPPLVGFKAFELSSVESFRNRREARVFAEPVKPPRSGRTKSQPKVPAALAGLDPQTQAMVMMALKKVKG